MRFPDVRRAEAGRFSHVLIDEYQDTNACQYRIIKSLALGHRNLCVVGDDDQSIYGWRGAEVAHILRFKLDWPEAKVVRLEDNYRSTAEILELANRLIAHNRTRHAKVLRASTSGGQRPRIMQCQDEEDEAKQVVNDTAHAADRARTAGPRFRPAVSHQRAIPAVRNGIAAIQRAVCAAGRDVVLRPQGSARSWSLI